MTNWFAFLHLFSLGHELTFSRLSPKSHEKLVVNSKKKVFFLGLSCRWLSYFLAFLEMRTRKLFNVSGNTFFHTHLLTHLAGVLSVRAALLYACQRNIYEGVFISIPAAFFLHRSHQMYFQPHMRDMCVCVWGILLLNGKRLRNWQDEGNASGEFKSQRWRNEDKLSTLSLSILLACLSLKFQLQIEKIKWQMRGHQYYESHGKWKRISLYFSTQDWACKIVNLKIDLGNKKLLTNFSESFKNLNFKWPLLLNHSKV